jgi:hypothetical protein
MLPSLYIVYKKDAYYARYLCCFTYVAVYSIGGTAGLNVTASVILAASSDLATNATTGGVLDIKGLKTQVSG